MLVPLLSTQRSFWRRCGSMTRATWLRCSRHRQRRQVGHRSRAGTFATIAPRTQRAAASRLAYCKPYLKRRSARTAAEPFCQNARMQRLAPRNAERPCTANSSFLIPPCSGLGWLGVVYWLPQSALRRFVPRPAPQGWALRPQRRSPAAGLGCGLYRGAAQARH